jgi:hypothetical protein
MDVEDTALPQNYTETCSRDDQNKTCTIPNTPTMNPPDFMLVLVLFEHGFYKMLA